MPWNKLFLLLAILVSPALLPTLPAQTGRPAEADGFQLPATGQSVKGQVMLLAIDDRSLPFRRALVLYLSKPKVRQEAVLKPSRDNPNAPDYLAAAFYGTVMVVQGKFRMWYFAIHGAPHLTDLDLVKGPICYAESQDGVHWVKPALGQVEFHGSRANNIIDLPGDRLEGVNVIIDPDEPDAQQRYKMALLTQYPATVEPKAAKDEDRTTWTLRTATSPDGFHWVAGPENQVRSFLEFSSLYKHDGLYIVNSHICGSISGRGESGRLQGREGYAWVSPDFRTWLTEPAPSFILPESLTGSGVNGMYVQDHEGIGGTDFGNVVVGLYGEWHQEENKTRNFNLNWQSNGLYADLGLVLSQDGIHFYEPVRNWVFISHEDSQATPVPGRPYRTILTMSNSILNYGDETRIYHGRWRNAPWLISENDPIDCECEVALATLPRDRWGALGLAPAVPAEFPYQGAPDIEDPASAAKDGAVWTAAVRLPSARDAEVWLNADGTKGMRVEIADDRFKLIPSFSGANSGRSARVSGLDCRVAWPHANLGELRGRLIRLRVLLNREGAPDPRLYAVYLRAP